MPVSGSFKLRLFHWAEIYARKQLESGFPLVRQFDQPVTRLFLKHMASLDDRQKRLLMRGLLGRFHCYAVEVLHEPADPEQVQLVERYLERGTLAFTTGEWRDLYPAVGNRLTSWQLRERALSVLGETLGVRTKCDVPGFLHFDAPMATGSVRTLICIHGRGADLAYFQEVWEADESRIKTCISALSLLGLTGGAVDWREVGEANVDRALQALRNGCVEFLSGAPSLLAESGVPSI